MTMNTTTKVKRLIFSLAVSGILGTLAGPVAAAPRVEFILDGSGSMWGAVAGEAKIEGAKRVMKDLVKKIDVPPDSMIGLTVYGHRRKGDCADIEHFPSVGYGEREQLVSVIEGISPKGKTPIADSLRTVGDLLKGKEESTSIVLVSDGIESCDKDPCAVAKELREQYGIDVTIHVVGFDVKDGQEQLQCVAKAGGGEFHSAANATELASVLSTIGTVVEKAAKPKLTSTEASPLSGIVVEPLTLEGFPKLEEVHVMKPKSRLDWAGLSPVRRSKQFGKKIIVPAGTYDITYKPMGGQSRYATVLIAGLEVPAKQTVTVHTDRVAAGIQVPEMEGVDHKGIYVVYTGARRDGAFVHGGSVQASKGFGTVMMVTAGWSYDILLDFGEYYLTPIAENVTPGHGGLLVVGQSEEEQANPTQDVGGVGGSINPFSGAEAGN